MLAWMIATAFCGVSLFVAYYLGYRAAMRQHARQLSDGDLYRQAVDQALDGVRGRSHVEIYVEARRARRPEMRATGSLGLHVVPPPEDD